MSFEGRIHERCACGSSFASHERLADSGSRFVLRGTDRVYERPRPFRIHHIDLELDLDHPGKALEGTACLWFERVSNEAKQLRLDAVAFEVEAVQLGRLRGAKRPKKVSYRATDYVYDGDTLIVTVPASVQRGVVRVKYRATPRRGMYFLAPDEAVPTRPSQIWTQCQDEDARHIFPCHDKPHIKQTMTTRVTAPKGWFVLSNGDLKSSRKDQRAGHFRYVMDEPLPSYLFTVVAGTFACVEESVGELPVTYYVPPEREADALRTFGKTPAMIRLFAKLTGVAYPWSKYAQVVVSDFIFGGMENTGATTMYEHILVDERAALDIDSDDLIAHELGHQWFGDLVTCRDWSHAWLNEGFATYLEHVWRLHDKGEDEYEQGLRVDLNAYLSEADGRYTRPVVCQDYEAPIDIFDRHLYEKGALFLHTLRLELGDDVFWSGVGRYLDKHRGGVVETRDLMRALEDASGMSLEQAFEQGVHRGGHPRLDVTISHEDDLLVVAVKQSVDSGKAPFALDLELDIAFGKGKPERATRRITKSQHTFAFRAKERPRYVVVDPRLRVIGRVAVKQPADMWRHQLAEAPTGRGRVLAAGALGKRDDPASIDALASALKSGRVFWGARAAAARALGNIRSQAAFDVLAAAVRIKQPKVRRAVAVALGNYRTPKAAELLAKLARDDDSYLVAASAARALGSTRQEEALDTLVELLDRDSWGEVMRAGAIDGIANLREERGVEHLKGQTQYGVPTRARRSAIAALVKLSSGRKIRELLEELLEDGDPHLRTSVGMALGELGDTKARPALRRALARDLDGRVRRRLREVLRDLGGRSRREMSTLREEVDMLRRQNAELSARLSKLEGRLADTK